MVLINLGRALGKLIQALENCKRVVRSVEISSWLYFSLRLYLAVMVTGVSMHRIANSWLTTRLTVCGTSGVSIWGRRGEHRGLNWPIPPRPRPRPRTLNVMSTMHERSQSCEFGLVFERAKTNLVLPGSLLSWKKNLPLKNDLFVESCTIINITSR